MYCMEVCVTYTFVTMSCVFSRVLSRFVRSVHPNRFHSRPERADKMREEKREEGKKGEKKMENQT